MSRLRRHPLVRAARELWLRGRVGLRHAPGVPGPIHPGDRQFTPALPEHYRAVGEQAAGLLRTAAADLRLPPDASVLDFGCGYGRVLRHLSAAFPEAVVRGVDRDPWAARFCRRHLGVLAEVVAPGAPPSALGGPFGLVWAGSVFTHLPPATWRERLGALVEVLAPGGGLVLTTHGPSCLEHPELYPVAPAADAHAREALARDGLQHTPYPWEPGYGITLVTRAYLERALGSAARLVAFTERGWDGHQDVAVAQRAG